MERGVSVHVSDILAVAFLPDFGRAVNACRFRDEDSERRFLLSVTEIWNAGTQANLGPG
jgi:hypothetical protein